MFEPKLSPTPIAFALWLFYLSRYLGADNNLAASIGLLPNALSLIITWFRSRL